MKRSNWRTRLIQGVMLAAAVAVIFSLAAQKSAGLQPGTDAPALALPTLDGDRLDLQALRGRPVVLNFFATWCPPCRSEMSELRSFQSSHPEVTVVGVALDSGDAAQVRAFAARYGVNFKIVLADEATAARFGVSQLPTTYLVHPDGRVGRSFVGAIGERTLVRATAGLVPPRECAAGSAC